MEVKDAVKLAKDYVANIFKDEKIREIGLEEVEYLEGKEQWLITVGFRRPFSRNAFEAMGSSSLKSFSANIREAIQNAKIIEERWYKVIEIDDKSGRINGMRDRLLSRPAA